MAHDHTADDHGVPARAASKRTSRIEWETLRRGVISRMTPHHGAGASPPPLAEHPALATKEAGPRRAASRRRALLFVALPFFATLAVALTVGLVVAFKVRVRPPAAALGLPLPSDLAGADGNRGPYTGELTYYAPGLGACGWTNGSRDRVAAVAHTVFDAAAAGSDPNANKLCGRRVRVRRAARAGKDKGAAPVEAVVVDRCEGCEPRDLDLSPELFGALAEEDEGRVQGLWEWVE